MTLVNILSGIGSCDFGSNIWASEVNLTALSLGENYGALVDGCNGSFGDCATSVTQEVVGLSETRPVDFGMSPNPADETLCVTSPENLESISIIDMPGPNLISQAGMFREIGISHLATGIYQVGVSTGDRICYQKLVIE